MLGTAAQPCPKPAGPADRKGPTLCRHGTHVPKHQRTPVKGARRRGAGLLRSTP